eukprot:2986286-Heterocapsa_arctica.AAC.1
MEMDKPIDRDIGYFPIGGPPDEGGRVGVPVIRGLPATRLQALPVVGGAPRAGKRGVGPICHREHCHPTR